MARIAGVDLPRRKAIAYALPYIYGIGTVWAKRLCKIAGIPEQKKVDELTEADVKAIREAIEANIKRLMDLGSDRGLRHRKGLPARGQRTRTNARTRKGPRKAMVRRAAPSP